MEQQATGFAPELDTLSNVLEVYPERFVSGSEDIRSAALAATKFVFDHALATEGKSRPHITELLTSLSSWDAPQTRSQTRAKTGKRKRSSSPLERKLRTLEITPLTSLFIDGTDNEQIWEQIDMRAKTVCGVLEDTLGEAEQGDDDLDSDAETRKMLKILETLEKNGMRLEDIMADDDDMTMDDEVWLDQHSEDEDEETESYDEGDDNDNDNDEEDEGDAILGEGVTGLQDPLSSDGDESFAESDPDLPTSTSNKTNASVLDDEFFNLVTFNAESEAAEAKHVSKGSLGRSSDSELSEEEEDASVDMFAPVEDFEQVDEDDLERNDGEAYYKDFFDPPPRGKRSDRQKWELPGKVHFHEEVQFKKIKSGKRKKALSTEDLLQPYDEASTTGGSVSYDSHQSGDPKDESDEAVEDDVSVSDASVVKTQEAIARLKDDLFADHDENDNEHLSTHQKRIAALNQEITRLEAENIGQKEWVLMGEASSRSRPQNSLLEEDLEFDRVMKAVPVITEENVQALEDKIKARILEGRFDDVIRKRPLDDKPFLPSRVMELKDTKSAQSLAQIYEADYVAAQSGDSVVDDRDGRLQKEHEELEKLWENICWKLDALCNAHFVPKQPKSTISTITNAPALSLESALPTAKSLSMMLAPKEIFTADRSGLTARSEMTPTEKRALRTKERKARKKTSDILKNSVDKFTKVKGIRGIKRGKEEALKTVLKSGKGVTVLGKQGRASRKKDHTAFRVVDR